MPPKRKNKANVVVDTTAMAESSQQAPASSQINSDHKVQELEEQIRLLRLENNILRQKVEEKSAIGLNKSKFTRNSVAQSSSINETQIPSQGAGTPVAKRIIKQVINSPMTHATKGCSCTGACANKKCGCVKKNMACNESCKCYNDCANKHKHENEEDKENQVAKETNVIETEEERDQNVATPEKPTGAKHKKEVKQPKEKNEKKNSKNTAIVSSDEVDRVENVETTQKTSKTSTAASKSKKEKKSKKAATASNDENVSGNDKTDQTKALENIQKPSTALEATEELVETANKKSAGAKQKRGTIANKKKGDKTSIVAKKEAADLIEPKKEPLTPGAESSVPPIVVKSMFDTPASNKSGPSPLAEVGGVSSSSSPEDDGIINPMKPRRQLPRSPVQPHLNNQTLANNTVNTTIITADDMFLPVPKIEPDIEEIPPPPELEQPEVDWEAHQATLVECHICKRKFHQHRVKKHEKSCKKI